MSNIFFAKSHLKFMEEIVKETREISTKILTGFGLHESFLYGCFYDDGSSYVLITDMDYYVHHTSKEYLVAPPVPPEILKKSFFYLPRPTGRYEPVIYDMRNLFNFENPFYYIERHIGYYEIICFTAPINNDEIINFYLNNTDILEKFFYYFKEKASRLIKLSEKNKIIIPSHMQANFKGLSIDPEPDDNEKKLILEQLVTRYYSLTGRPIKFSKREMECLKCLSMGRTAKETANIVGLSQRTVEYYINNIKHKVGCRSKSKLIDFIIDNELFK